MTRSFRPFTLRERDNAEQLPYERIDRLGLYVHIPFCKSLCGFCPYCKTQYKESKAGHYREALLREIELVTRGREKKEVTSLYFGGGSPALMADSLKEIVESLRRHFIIREGIGVELHPDDVCRETLEKLKDAGVTMVSLGVQSFSAECLQNLGRDAANPRSLAEKLELVRACGFQAVDVDLIFAIPGQTADSLKRDMKLAFAHGATQVSTYPLIGFSCAPNAGNPNQAVPEPEKRKLLRAAAACAEELGLERTSVWTFALKGARRYSSVTRDCFLGFGVSAVSLLGGEFKLNTFSTDAYVERIRSNSLPTSLTLKFTRRQRAVYTLFWKCYTMRLNPVDFEKAAGVPLQKSFPGELFLAGLLGWVEKKDGDYRLTPRGAYRYHVMEQACTQAYIDKVWRISRAGAFPSEIKLY